MKKHLSKNFYTFFAIFEVFSRTSAHTLLFVIILASLFSFRHLQKLIFVKKFFSRLYI